MHLPIPSIVRGSVCEGTVERLPKVAQVLLERPPGVGKRACFYVLSVEAKRDGVGGSQGIQSGSPRRFQALAEIFLLFLIELIPVVRAYALQRRPLSVKLPQLAQPSGCPCEEDECVPVQTFLAAASERRGNSAEDRGQSGRQMRLGKNSSGSR